MTPLLDELERYSIITRDRFIRLVTETYAEHHMNRSDARYWHNKRNYADGMIDAQILRKLEAEDAIKERQLRQRYEHEHLHTMQQLENRHKKLTQKKQEFDTLDREIGIISMDLVGSPHTHDGKISGYTQRLWDLFQFFSRNAPTPTYADLKKELLKHALSAPNLPARYGYAENSDIRTYTISCIALLAGA